MKKTIPLIPSSQLCEITGLRHVRRLWLKVSLAAAGKLAKGYPDIGKGFDDMLCQFLEIGPDAIRAYIRDHKPAYVAFANWLMGQSKALTIDQKDAFNSSIMAYRHDNSVADPILIAAGLPQNGSFSLRAVVINQFDDMDEQNKSTWAVEVAQEVVENVDAAE